MKALDLATDTPVGTDPALIALWEPLRAATEEREPRSSLQQRLHKVACTPLGFPEGRCGTGIEKRLPAR